MKNAILGLVIGFVATTSAYAEGLSNGALELSVNAIRSEGLDPNSNTYPNFTSAPIRIGYQLNEQFTLFGGYGLSTKSDEAPNEAGTAIEETTVRTHLITGGAIINMASGVMIEGSWTRALQTIETGGGDADYKGNHFEAFLGRRFTLSSGLFVEPKAGVTFGSVELDNDDVDVSYKDGLGTEYAVTLGYML